ncbi:MAG: NUDIX hydrolase [Patescibacteria group bacterium]
MQKMFVANKALIVDLQGYVLLLQDSGTQEDHEGGAGVWDIPGGRMDKEDKTLSDALVRELKEETGVDFDVSSAQILSASVWSISGDDDRRVTAIIYLLKVNKRPEIKLSNEHDDFGWFKPEEVDGKIPSPCLRQVLKVYKEQGSSLTTSSF